MTLTRIACIGMLMALAACNPPALTNLKNIGKESDPTRFYTLNATTEAQTDMAAMPYLVLGVGPVSVADYLDRSQIVVRESSNELVLAEFDRWAGKPAAEIQRVLGANLATLLGTERVVSYPWKSTIEPDMVVEVTVERFEYGQGKALLTAAWQVYSDSGRDVVAFRRSTLSKESGEDYEAIATALSELTAELSGEMAESIRAAYRNRP